MILEKYTTMVMAIKQLKTKNQDVFNKLEEMEKERAVLENDLKVWARENGDTDNGFVKVQKISKWRKWYDIEIIKKNKAMFKLIKDAGAYTIEERVDKEMIDKLANSDENFKRELLVEAYKEEQLTPSIKITIL